MTCINTMLLQTLHYMLSSLGGSVSVLQISSLLSAIVTGITKTHNLRFQESEALQAVFASHLCPNVLKAPARLAAQYSVNEFRTSKFYRIQQ